jgi:hypothetical protein
MTVSAAVPFACNKPSSFNRGVLSQEKMHMADYEIFELGRRLLHLKVGAKVKA